MMLKNLYKLKLVNILCDFLCQNGIPTAKWNVKSLEKSGCSIG